MINFENKKVEIEFTDQAGQRHKVVDYAGLTVLMLNNSPHQGWTAKAMRDEIRIIEKMENATLAGAVEISLENAELDYIKSRMPEKWTLRHKDIPGYIEYIEGLKSTI